MIDTEELIDQAVRILAGRRWTCLTGAGISTDSGIPDYRGPDSPRANPMLYSEFTGVEENRQRYWARSFLGWQRMDRAIPNAGHRALAELTSYGMNGLITQNVDGLHEEAAAAVASSGPIVDLHGRIDRVICLNCHQLTDRAAYQDRLRELNPDVHSDEPLGHAELRPDGDAVVDDWSHFRVAPCLNCGGILKPDVIFFGESVPKERVQSAYALVEESEVLLVAGSSLTVMSGLRFARHDAKQGKPVIIINRGATRADDLSAVKIDAGTSEVLRAIRRQLAQ